VLAARAALWLGDRDGLGSAIARLEAMGMQGRAVAAAELTLRAGEAALADDAAAGTLYADAVAAWRSVQSPLQLGLCLAERRRFLPALGRADGDTVADADAEEAEAILVGLGATGMLDAIRPLPAPTAGAPRS
jgi:hypothetical protein